jgi:hypothetical protein
MNVLDDIRAQPWERCFRTFLSSADDWKRTSFAKTANTTTGESVMMDAQQARDAIEEAAEEGAISAAWQLFEEHQVMFTKREKLEITMTIRTRFQLRQLLPG